MEVAELRNRAERFNHFVERLINLRLHVAHLLEGIPFFPAAAPSTRPIASVTSPMITVVVVLLMRDGLQLIFVVLFIVFAFLSLINADMCFRAASLIGWRRAPVVSVAWSQYFHSSGRFILNPCLAGGGLFGVDRV